MRKDLVNAQVNYSLLFLAFAVLLFFALRKAWDPDKSTQLALVPALRTCGDGHGK